MANDGIILSDNQVAALEKKKHDDNEACGEMETAHPGYLGSQETFYVGNLKGVGRIYQQTFVDTYSKVAFDKLYCIRQKYPSRRQILSMIKFCLSLKSMSCLCCVF